MCREACRSPAKSSMRARPGLAARSRPMKPPPLFWPTAEHHALLAHLLNEMRTKLSTLLWATSCSGAEETFRAVRPERFSAHASLLVHDARACESLGLRRLVSTTASAGALAVLESICACAEPRWMFSRNFMEQTTLVTLVWDQGAVLDDVTRGAGRLLAPASSSPTPDTTATEHPTLFLFAQIDEHPRAASRAV